MVDPAVSSPLFVFITTLDHNESRVVTDIFFKSCIEQSNCTYMLVESKVLVTEFQSYENILLHF